MSYKEEKENYEEESSSKQESQNKKEKNSKKDLIFFILIIISIITGISSIFFKPKNKNISINVSSSDIINAATSTQKDGIAIIDLTGIITHSKKTTSLGVEFPSVVEVLISDFEYYLKNENVKAIVLQVDSPGGELTSCEETLKYLQELKNKYPKPIIASFRSIACSGGYYISMIADKIYANESTLTGSIGVISQFFNVSTLMDKYGIKMYTIKSGKNKDSFSPFREPRADELAYWQDMTEEFVAQFANVVEQSRGNKIKGNREDIFDGRVFSGKMALEIGLIDSIGILQDAIKDAAKMGGLKDEDPYIIKKPSQKNNIINILFNNISNVMGSKHLISQILYEDIIKHIGVPMYIYIPNYIGEN